MRLVNFLYVYSYAVMQVYLDRPLGCRLMYRHTKLDRWSQWWG